MKTFGHCFSHIFSVTPLLSSLSGTPVTDVRPLGIIPQATKALCSLSVIFSFFVFHFLCLCVSFEEILLLSSKSVFFSVQCLICVDPSNKNFLLNVVYFIHRFLFLSSISLCNMFMFFFTSLIILNVFVIAV